MDKFVTKRPRLSEPNDSRYTDNETSVAASTSKEPKDTKQENKSTKNVPVTGSTSAKVLAENLLAENLQT